MSGTFELGNIDGSAAYRLASQVVIPRLKVEVFPNKGAEPFSLRDAIYSILDDEVAKGHLTKDQLAATARVSADGIKASLASTTRWYVRHILKSAGDILSSDVRGQFILAGNDAIEEEAEEEAAESAEPANGSIYAYSFPSLKEVMIKVGKASGNVADRINQQLGAANPEAPEIMKTWTVTDIHTMEIAIHSILKARGKQVEAPRAKEWFRANVDEVEAIIKFVKGS
jgi:hypothetical protein